MLFSKKYLLGELAKWAVNQSPYYVPDNLEKVLRKLADLLPTHEFDEGYGFRKMKIKDFHTWLFNVLTQIPELVEWNSPKDGSNPQFVFTSRFDKPHPDSDIVDLDALVNNIRLGLLKDNR